MTAVSEGVSDGKNQEEHAELLLKQEHEPMILGPDAFVAFIAKEMDRVGTIVKTANIRIEN